MRLSFGAGIVFLPFAVVASSEQVIAKSYGEHLSDVVASLIAPFVGTVHNLPDANEAEDEPVAAVVVSEEAEADTLEPAATDVPRPGARRRDGPNKPRAKGDRAQARDLPAIYVAARTVVRIANSGARPSGKSVTADGQRPAGVQVFGASALGIGVRDGDVIVRVNGVPVTSANQVIGLVIAARGARQPTISAQMYRGHRTYQLTVEQPYMDGAAEPPQPKLDGPSSQSDAEPESGTSRR